MSAWLGIKRQDVIGGCQAFSPQAPLGQDTQGPLSHVGSWPALVGLYPELGGAQGLPTVTTGLCVWHQLPFAGDMNLVGDSHLVYCRF